MADIPFNHQIDQAGIDQFRNLDCGNANTHLMKVINDVLTLPNVTTNFDISITILEQIGFTVMLRSEQFGALLKLSKDEQAQASGDYLKGKQKEHHFAAHQVILRTFCPQIHGGIYKNTLFNQRGNGRQILVPLGLCEPLKEEHGHFQFS